MQVTGESFLGAVSTQVRNQKKTFGQGVIKSTKELHTDTVYPLEAWPCPAEHRTGQECGKDYGQEELKGKEGDGQR